MVAWAVDAVTCADATANRCAGSTTCISDYVIIPGTVFTGAATGTFTYDRYFELFAMRQIRKAFQLANIFSSDTYVHDMLHEDKDG